MGWSQYVLGEAGVVLAVAGALIRLLPHAGAATDLDHTPTLLAQLVGGRRRALSTAIAMLGASGTVRAEQPGLIERAADEFTSDDPLLAATYAALDVPNGPRGIVTRPAVEQALAALQRQLVAARLALPTRRVVVSRLVLAFAVALAAAGIRQWPIGVVLLVVVLLVPVAVELADRLPKARLAAAVRFRQDYPLSHAEGATDPETIGYLVAAHGNAALLAIMPEFAETSGLLDGGIAVQLDAAAAAAPDPGPAAPW